MLMQFYDLESTNDKRILFQNSARQIMSAVIRPLAELLTLTPLNDKSGQNAAAPFEFYTDLRISNVLQNNIQIMNERLTEESKECFRLSKSNTIDLERLNFIGENLKQLSNKFTL